MDTRRIVRHLTAATIVVALGATACGSDASDDIASDVPICDSTLTIGVTQEAGMVDGLERTWQLAVPDSAPIGLIVDLHGTGGTIEAQDRITRLSTEGPARGYVVATPQGLETPARWTVTGIPGPDDVAFISQLATSVRSAGCVDGPMFATGKSSGAAMATQLACETDLFTGVVPIGGISLYRRCPEGDPISVLTFHGTEDAWVPYVGPEGWEQVEAMPDAFFIGDPAETVVAFAGRAGCDDASSTSQLGDDTTVEEWSCPDGHRVAFYTVNGGGHTHPGSHARQVYEEAGLVDSVGHTTETFDGTDVMLDFFDSLVDVPQ